MNEERDFEVKVSHSAYSGAGKLHIVSENSCADNISFENGFPISQKNGGET